MTLLDAPQTQPNGRRPLSTIVGIALHHTVTTSSPNASEQSERAHLARIDADHVRREWGGFGYHYAVFPSGRVYCTGWGQRAHVSRRNHELIGVAWVADLSARAPNEWEIAFAAEAVRDAWERIGRRVPVNGHNAWAILPEGATSCPGLGQSVVGRVKSAAEEPEMSEDRMRAIAREELERVSQGAGLGTPDLALGIGAIWHRLQRVRMTLTQGAVQLQGSPDPALQQLAQRLREAADALDPNRPWR